MLAFRYGRCRWLRRRFWCGYWLAHLLGGEQGALRTGRSGRGELGLRCNLGVQSGLLSGGSGNLVLGLPAIHDVARSAQWAANQACLIGRVAVRFKRFFGCQVLPGLCAFNYLLRNLHRHLNRSATDNTPPCGCGKRALGSGLKLLRSLSGRKRRIIYDAQNTLHNPFAKYECSASTFQCSLPGRGNTGFGSIDLDWFAALHLGGGLAFHVGAKELREHRTGCA